MTNKYAIKITIDGASAKSEAVRMRQVIERELAQIATVSFDTKSLEQMLKSAGDIDIEGVVQIVGLEAAAEQIQALHMAASEQFIVRGRMQMEGLAAARAQMKGIREDAGALGRAVASGLGRQGAAIERHLTDLQSRITGLVRAGSKIDIDAPLEGLERMGEGLAEDEKKTYSLTLKMRQLQEQLNVVNRRFAELGAVKVQPMGGGALETMEDLFRAFDKPHVRYQIRKSLRGIEADEEILRLGSEIEAASKIATQQAEQATAGISAAMMELEAKMQAAQLEAPPGMASTPRNLFSESQREWQTGFDAMRDDYLRMEQELQASRTTAMTGDADELKEQLKIRRHRLEGPLREEHVFWREWAMDSVDDVTRELRYHGQSVAAESLAEMHAIWERRKSIEAQMKRGRGRLVKGSQAELPKEAKGTMVDFIQSERVLESAARGATDQLDLQWKMLKKLIDRLDQAAMAADGLSESERMAFTRMQQLASREIKKRTPLTKTTMEDAGAVSMDVLTRLSKQAAQVNVAMREELSSPAIAAAAAKPAGKIVALWQRVRDVLVGHSIIPDMVRDINLWLAQVGAESPFGQMVAEGEGAAGRIVSRFSQLAEALPMEQVEGEVSGLTAVIRELEQEFNQMMVRGTEASERYKRGVQEAGIEVRKVLGTSPAIEGKLARGMLPRGFGVGAAESQWQRAGGRRPGAGEREGDVWYQALNVGLEEVQRFSIDEKAQLDALWDQIVSKQAQLAALVRAQLAQAGNVYSDKLSEAANAEEFERLYQQLDATGTKMQSAEGEMANAIGAVSDRVADEVAQAAALASREASALARTPAARAESEARIAQARAAAETEKQLAKQTTAAVLGEEKRETALVVAQAKYRQKQKEEAAKRATLKAKALRQSEIEASKAEGRVSVEVAKATGRAKVEEERRVTAKTKQQIKERDRATRESAAQQRRESTARGLAAEMGVQWDTYVQGALNAGQSLDEVVGALRRVKREQGQVTRGARQIDGGYRKATSGVARFAEELNRARMESQGMGMIINDIGQVGRSLQFGGTALIGSLTMAGKSYLDLARQADTASRSLLLNEELTGRMRHEIIALAATYPLLDPQTAAEGITVWAQATGQAVDGAEDLQRILEQTVPIQQLAALTNAQIGTVTDGTAATLRQFGLTLDDTNRVVAIFNKVADDTLAEVGDISEAFKFVGPQAREMGESVEETAAVLGIMADQNIRGSQAGRAYRQMLISLVDPTEEAREQLQQLFGTEQPFYDAEGQFVGIIQVVDMLAAVTEDATDAERDMLLSTLFTSNALPGVTALIHEQTEAREHGINAARAQAKLLDGTIDDEVLAYGRMKKAIDGTTISMMSATDLWDRQLEDFTESDVARLDAMKVRWQTFWLAIGENVVSTALPAIETAGDALARITGLIQDNSVIGRAIGAIAPAGGIAVAIGTLLTTGRTVARALYGLKTFGTAMKRMSADQVAAGSQLQAQVISAGEQFATIIVSAAETAAATGVAGEETEAAIGITGEETEAAIGIAGAEKEVVVELVGAGQEVAAETGGSALRTMFTGAATTVAATKVGGSLMGMIASGLTKAGSLLMKPLAGIVVGLAAGNELSKATIDQGLLGWFTQREGEEAGQERLVELEGQSRTELLAEMGRVRRDLAIVQEVRDRGPLTAYTGIFRQGENYEQYEDIMGGYIKAQSGTALTDKIAELETVESALAFMIGDATDLTIDYWARHQEIVAVAVDAADRLYEKPAPEHERLGEEQQKAAELYIEMLQKQEDAVDDFNDALTEAMDDLASDLDKLTKDFEKTTVEENATFRDSEIKSDAEHHRRQAKAKADHDLKMRRMEDDHLFRMGDLIGQRDALGMRREKMQYDLKRGRAEQDFSRSQDETDARVGREREQRRIEHEARMEERKVEFEDEKVARIAEHEEREADIRTQHQDEMDRLTEEYFDKINAELGFFADSQNQQNTYFTLMLADASKFLEDNRQIWQDHIAGLPVPSTGRLGEHGYPGWYAGGGPEPGYQTGGYIPRTGSIRAHQGEFMLSALTAKAIERGTGPLTQDRMIAGMARGGGYAGPSHVTVQQNLEFHGAISAEERGRFREEAYDQAVAVVGRVFG